MEVGGGGGGEGAGRCGCVCEVAQGNRGRAGRRKRHKVVQSLEINLLEYAPTFSVPLHHSCFNLREQLDPFNVFAPHQTVP